MTTLPLLLLLLLLPIILLKILKRNKLNLPPSPLKLPIIGNLHQLGSLPHRSLHSLSLKHGPLMLLHLGQTPTLVVSSPDLIKQIIKSHDITFSNRHQTTAAKIFFYNCRDIAFAPYGNYWRHARKLCVLELLSTKRVQSFQFIRDQEVGNLLAKIHDDKIQHGFVDLTEMIRSVVSNIVARCVMGRKAERGSGFGELARDVMGCLSAFCFGDYFGWLGWVDVVSGLIGRMKGTFNALDCLLDEVIEEHRRSYMSLDDDRKDFVDILLQLQKDNTLDVELTQNDIKAILQNIFVGGTDTTSTVLEWAMTELIKNPDKVKKVQKEIRAVIERNNTSKIEMNDVEEMKYLKCVIKETLRIHTPGPFLLPRENTTSIKLGGYDIPNKITLFLNIWAIHMDSKVWDRPEEFIPERFMNDEIDYKGFDFHYLPLGVGRRICPGITFAVGSIGYVIANVLYWYDWKLFGSQELDMSEDFGLSLTKRLPLVLEPTPYSP